MKSESLRRSAEVALSKAWADIKGTAIFRPEPAGYLREPKNNLVDGITFESFSADFDQGAGNELKCRKTKSGKTEPPKFCAAYSSSALVANTFAFFKNGRNSLSLFGTGLSKLCLEGCCPTGLGGTPPNLDVLITGTGSVIGIESKCTEYFEEKEAEFSPSYESIKDRFEAGWRAVYEALKVAPRLFRHLDAAQLVKHYLGLRCRFPGEKKILLYLYWEPENAAQFPMFGAHRESIREFKKSVAASEVEFQAQSYIELWQNWEKSSQDHELLLHVQNLKQRYCFTLPA